MDINGRTKLYGIFGYPLSHTLSPRLHNAVFERQKVDAVYLPFEVKPDYIGEAIDALRSLGIAGVNVTFPHKEEAAKLVDEIPHDIDRGIGAINTIVARQGHLAGFNTDGPGFMEDIKDKFNFSPDGKRVFLVGAGGAARAIAFCLVKAGCGELMIHNRTPERAKGLSDYISSFFPKSEVRAVLSVDEIRGNRVDLLVNATSCGMKPEDPFPVNPDMLRMTQLVYDVIYTPSETKLIREARKKKMHSANGIGMLVYQAAFAQALWFPDTDKRAVANIMKETLAVCPTA